MTNTCIYVCVLLCECVRICLCIYLYTQVYVCLYLFTHPWKCSVYTPTLHYYGSPKLRYSIFACLIYELPSGVFPKYCEIRRQLLITYLATSGKLQLIQHPFNYLAINENSLFRHEHTESNPLVGCYTLNNNCSITLIEQ